jgi:hypothetical protein
MEKFKVLMFEDTASKVDSFKMLLSLRLNTELGVELILVNRNDDSFLSADLVSTQFDLILVDDDLGNDLWGNQVIENIMEETGTNPDYRKVKIIYYSSGTSVTDLKEKTKKFGQISCVSYNELIDIVINSLKGQL